MISTIFLTTSLTFSQAEAVKIYNPEANAREDIAAAVKQAKAENKHVLLQIGGNWCPWCVKLHGLETSDAQIDSLLNADYVRVMVNIPREKDKRDYELLATLENPQRFGFPVLDKLNGPDHADAPYVAGHVVPAELFQLPLKMGHDRFERSRYFQLFNKLH